MDVTKLEASAGRVSEYLKVLSTPTRLAVLCQLVNGEKSVGELCDAVDMKQPAMSQQLSILKREQLVTSRRDAQTIHYSISDKKTIKLMNFLHKTFCEQHD